MLTIVLLSVLSGVYFYIESLKAGLAEKRWALAGVILGPLLFPMFTISRHVRMRRDTGFNNAVLRA